MRSEGDLGELRPKLAFLGAERWGDRVVDRVTAFVGDDRALANQMRRQMHELTREQRIGDAGATQRVDQCVTAVASQATGDARQIRDRIRFGQAPIERAVDRDALSLAIGAARVTADPQAHRVLEKYRTYLNDRVAPLPTAVPPRLVPCPALQPVGDDAIDHDEGHALT